MKPLFILPPPPRASLLRKAISLAEDHPRYFNTDKAHDTIPLENMVPTRANEDSIARAELHMHNAYKGAGAKRDPITVRQTTRGKYEVVDGNSTFAIAKKHGWSSIPVCHEDNLAKSVENPSLIHPPIIPEMPAIHSVATAPHTTVKTMRDAPKKPPKLFPNTDHLPAQVRQPHTELPKLLDHAREGHEQMLDILNRDKGIGPQMGFHVHHPEQGIPTYKEHGGIVAIGPMKTEARIKAKAHADYKHPETGEPEYDRVHDIVRASVAVDHHHQLHEVLNRLKNSGVEIAKQPKDRFRSPTPVGYRDGLMHMKLPNGHLAELQLHVKPMVQAKEGPGHHHYEEMQKIERAHPEGRSGWSDEEHQRYEHHVEASKKLYNEAWAKATGGAVPSHSGLSKSYDMEDADLEKALSDPAKHGGVTLYEYKHEFPAYMESPRHDPFILKNGHWVKHLGYTEFLHNSRRVDKVEFEKMLKAHMPHKGASSHHKGK